MNATIETVLVSQKLDTLANKNVTCIFCGLPTPVPACPSKLESNIPRHIFIVRCTLCGKEAPYRARDDRRE
jgi:hypothetical protein